MRKRLLLAGAGHWGSILLRNFLQHPQARVAGVVTHRTLAPESLEPGTEIFSSFEEALKHKWDGILLATPPSVHGKQLARCLEKGIPTFVEKPLCLSLPEAQELYAQFLTTKTPVLVDHIHLFTPAYQWLKQRLENEKIYRIRSEGGNWGPFRNGYSALWDYGSHDLSVMIDLLGKPRVLRTKTHEEKAQDGGIGGDYSVDMEFTGATASFRVSNLRKEKKRSYEIETEKEIFHWQDAPVALLESQDKISGVRNAITVEATKPLANVISVFCDGLDGIFDSRWGLELGLEVVRALSDCEKVRS